MELKVRELIHYKTTTVRITSILVVHFFPGWQMNSKVGCTSVNQVGEINKVWFALRGGNPR